MKKIFFFFVFGLAAFSARSQAFYDINTIQKIELNFSQSNWDYMMDTANGGSESYLMAQWIKINGTQFDSVGVRYKGNSSYNANNAKNPLHIELDTYKNQDYQGYSDIKLSNVYKDPSFVREVLSYNILRKYMDAPLSNYAQVYINGQLAGLFSSSESVSKKFLWKHFNSNQNSFFKCNPPAGAGPGSSVPNLVFLGNDSSQYYVRYDIKSDYGWRNLLALCDTLASNSSNIEKILDTDRALWMLAFDNTLVNLDSYLGGFAQNYYLYQDDYKRFLPVVWDLNESFGGFNSTGTIMLGNTTAKQQMTHLLHAADANWPLVQKLFAVPMYKRMYIAHMRTILAENFSNNEYYTFGQTLQSIIDTAVQSDVNKFYTYANFQNNLTIDVGTGPQTFPGITNLMNGRKTFLLAQTDFTNVPPAISGIVPSSSSPSLNGSVFITATVTNSNLVLLGYRYNLFAPFKRITMYDDGAHGDGSASDGVFGVSVPVNSNLIQYFIYAENNNAGMFSPERAEHEFYVLNATSPQITKGDVVINEILAVNSNNFTNSKGKHEDWIELYNNTSNYISLNDAYLSDSIGFPAKWKFPENTIISPNGYLIVWADTDSLQSGSHANFKLTSAGEAITLAYSTGSAIDSVAFGAQTADVAYARCPNGTGSFVLTFPTFSSENCIDNSVQSISNGSFTFYPNPTNGRVYVSSAGEKISVIEGYNLLGKKIISQNNLDGASSEINLSEHPSGLYIILINHSMATKILKN